MKKTSFLIFSIFFVLNAFALSSVYTINDNTKIRSERSDTTEKNIIKVLAKDQKLQRSTMHYSGWSMVSIGSISGWVLSQELTDQPPVVNTVKPSLDFVKKIKNLEQINAKLSSDMADMKALLASENDKLTKENTFLKQQVLQLSSQLESLTLANKKLLDNNQKNTTNKPEKTPTQTSATNKLPTAESVEVSDSKNSSMFDININWTYAAIALLLIVLSFIATMFSNSKRRRSDLNTIRRY